MASQLFYCEVIEEEHRERNARKCYLTRDFFVNGEQYNWTHNMELGDGSLIRFGVRQGWPLEEGGREPPPIESNELYVSALGLAPPGGFAGIIDPKPTLDDI